MSATACATRSYLNAMSSIWPSDGEAGFKKNKLQSLRRDKILEAVSVLSIIIALLPFYFAATTSLSLRKGFSEEILWDLFWAHRYSLSSRSSIILYLDDGLYCATGLTQMQQSYPTAFIRLSEGPIPCHLFSSIVNIPLSKESVCCKPLCL